MPAPRAAPGPFSLFPFFMVIGKNYRDGLTWGAAKKDLSAAVVDFGDLIPFEVPNVKVGHLKIINETAYRSEAYTGVSLNAKSLFSGMENTTFAESDIFQGKDTILPEQQFVTNGEDNTIV